MSRTQPAGVKYMQSPLQASCRVAGVMLCAQVVLLITGSASYAQAAAFTADEVFVQTNVERARENLAPLSRNSRLDHAAQLKADDMAEKGYYAHVSPEGRTPMYFVERAGYAYSIIGENLVVQRTTAAQVLAAFMGSPGHRANILRTDFSEIGIGIADGAYKGNTTTFTVQIFAKPAAAVPPAPTVEKPVSRSVAPVRIPEEPVVATVPRGDTPMTLVPTVAVDVPRIESVPDPIEVLRETVRPLVTPLIDAAQQRDVQSATTTPAAENETDTAISPTVSTTPPSAEAQPSHVSQPHETFIFVPTFINAPVPVRMGEVPLFNVGTPPLPVGSVWSQEWRTITSDIAQYLRTTTNMLRRWITP